MNHDRLNRGAERSGIPGEALPLARALGQQARRRRRPVRTGVLAPHRRILLALTALLGVLVAIPTIAIPTSAAGPAVAATTDFSGFPLWYEDANGVRVDTCVDTADDHCPLLPNPGVFDPTQPVVFPTNFPDEFFYSVVETDRLVTPGCAGATDPIAAAPGTVSIRLALEGAFINGNPAINEQMVFNRTRIIVRGGLCPNQPYTFDHPYGSTIITTDETGSVRATAGTVDIGCVPTPQVLCNFGQALNGPMLTTGFLRWDPAIAPLADPGYLGGDINTFHEITGGLNGVNSFTVTGPGLAAPITTNLFTVAGRLAGPVVGAPTLVDFGGQSAGATSNQRTVTLTNVGADGWFVQPGGITTTDTQFTVANTNCPTAAPGLNRDQTCDVFVTFTPNAVGPVPAGGAPAINLVVNHNGLHSPYNIGLKGTGINNGDEPLLSITPTTLNFGSVRVGLLSTSQTVTITNPGVAPLQVSSIDFIQNGGSQGPLDPDSFRLTHDGCTGVVVAAGGVEQCSIQVAFQPIVARSYSADLEIVANTSGGPERVLLTAIGIGGVAAVSKDNGGAVALDPTNGFPNWYQDEAGLRVGQCLDFQDPNCIVLPDGFYTGGPVGGIVNGTDYLNFPEEFFWYVAESDPVATPGCGAVGPGSAFIRFAGEGAFVNGDPVVGEAMSFGRIRVSGTGLCPNTNYTIVHPYGRLELQTDGTGKLRRNQSTQDIGCAPAPGEVCNFEEALQSPVFGGFLKQVNPPAGYLGSPINPQPVTGSLYIDDREIVDTPVGETPGYANYFRIFQSNDPLALDLETELFTVMGKLVGPMVASPSSLGFGTVEVGVTSDPQTVTLTNDGNGTVAVASITKSGVAAMLGDFTVTNDTCSGTSLLAHATCTFDVSFTPAANGTRTIELLVGHDGNNNPLKVRVSGVGGAPVGEAAISVQPVQVDFPDLHTGELSASESVRISNIGGTADLLVGLPVITGLDADQFVITQNTCDVPVAPDGECLIRVAYQPTVAGAASASLDIPHNVTIVANPLSVPLTGYGFAGNAAQSPGNTPSGFADWYQDNNGVRVEACLTQGDPGCILLADAGFNPAQPLSFPNNFPSEFFWYLAETDPTFAVTDDQCGATGTASIRIATEGTFVGGTPLAGDQLTFNRVRVDVAGLCGNTTYQFVHPYGTVQITTDGTGDGSDTADLNNMTGSRPMTGAPDQATGGGLLRWDPVDGGAPAGYLGDAVTLHTVIGSTYRPEGPGTEPANYFEVQALVDGNFERIARNDQFVVAGKLAGPIDADQTALQFGPQPQGTTSASQVVTVTNLQRDPIQVAPTLGGSNPSAFSITGGTCGLSTTLGLDDSCTLLVALSPSLAESEGSKTAALLITHDGLHSPVSVALSGTVTLPGQPEISFTPTSHAFGNQNVGVPSAIRTVQVTNTGTAQLDITSISLTGTAANVSQFSFTENCLPALAVGAPACTISVRFTPTSTGNKTASLRIETNDPVRPFVTVTLTGTGVAPQVSVSPTSLSFSTKGTSSKSVQLTNTGTATLSLVGAPAISIQPSLLATSNPSKFTAANVNCNNVAPGGKCTINVTFNPGAGATNQVFTATLRITTNAINPVTTVALTGTRK